MKNKIILLLILNVCILLSLSCSKDDESKSNQFLLPIQGVYEWQFEIPNISKQVSTHTFYKDSIKYTMAGGAYTNEYMQIIKKYDPKEQRCISMGKGGGKDGVYFVMFFKDITDTTVTIYKKQCKNREEAEIFPIPPADTEEDHGWNVYYKK